MCRVGQNHTFIGIYGVFTVFLAGKSPYIRSFTVCIYGSGQPCICVKFGPGVTQGCRGLRAAPCSLKATMHSFQRQLCSSKATMQFKGNHEQLLKATVQFKGNHAVLSKATVQFKGNHAALSKATMQSF